MSTNQYAGDPARVEVLLGRKDQAPRRIRGGMVDPRAALAIKVRLPDGQGVVVAARDATLRYRAQSSDWLSVTGDAALLPAAATQVEVSRPGAAPVVVDLT